MDFKLSLCLSLGPGQGRRGSPVLSRGAGWGRRAGGRLRWQREEPGFLPGAWVLGGGSKQPSQAPLQQGWPLQGDRPVQRDARGRLLETSGHGFVLPGKRRYAKRNALPGPPPAFCLWTLFEGLEQGQPFCNNEVHVTRTSSGASWGLSNHSWQPVTADPSLCQKNEPPL